MIDTGALKNNSGKLRLSLIPPSLSLYIGAVLTFGALKYEDHNWRKGFNWSILLDSLKRHLTAFEAGEDLDAESGLPHLAHIATNVAFLIEHESQDLGEDDRYVCDVGSIDLKWNPIEKFTGEKA